MSGQESSSNVRPRHFSPVDVNGDSTIEILDRAQRGDTAAIQTLIGRAMPSVRRWARGRLPRYVRQEANTEDVLQDAVLRTLQALKRVRHRTVGGMQAYSRTGVINRIRDLIRGTNRRGVPLELEDNVSRPIPVPARAGDSRREGGDLPRRPGPAEAGRPPDHHLAGRAGSHRRGDCRETWEINAGRGDERHARGGQARR